MKKIFAILLIGFAGQFAFATGEEIKISDTCHTKISKFAKQFVEASMLNLGDASYTIDKIVVDPIAVKVDESGAADGRGSYEVNIVEEDEIQTSKFEFNFRYVMEPHCSVWRIQMSNLL